MAAPQGRGETAIVMAQAAAAGKDFADAGVPDTPGNRALYAKIVSEVTAIDKAGQVASVPFDHSLM